MQLRNIKYVLRFRFAPMLNRGVCDHRVLVEKGELGMLCFDVNVETCTIQGNPLLVSAYCLVVAAGLKSVISFPVTVPRCMERYEARGSPFSPGPLRSPHMF